MPTDHACDCEAIAIPTHTNAHQRQALELTPEQAQRWAGMVIHTPHCASVAEDVRGGHGVLRVITPAP